MLKLIMFDYRGLLPAFQVGEPARVSFSTVNCEARYPLFACSSHPIDRIPAHDDMSCLVDAVLDHCPEA
jgi:hypothetical protein